MSTMTWEKIRDHHLGKVAYYTDEKYPRAIQRHQAIADFITAHLAQPAQAVETVPAWPKFVQDECLEVLRNMDTELGATGRKSARIERLINAIAGMHVQAVDAGAGSAHKDEDPVKLARAVCEAVIKHQFQDKSRHGRLTLDVETFLRELNAARDLWLTRALSVEKAGPVDGWISVEDRLPECDMTPASFGVPVELKPGFFDGVKHIPNAFYGCRQTDKPNFYLYGAVFHPTHWRYPASPAPDKENL